MRALQLTRSSSLRSDAEGRLSLDEPYGLSGYREHCPRLEQRMADIMPGLFIVQGGPMDAEARSKALDDMIAADIRRVRASFAPKRDWQIEKCVDDACGIACAHLGAYEQTTVAQAEMPEPTCAALVGSLSSKCKSEARHIECGGSETNGSLSSVEALVRFYRRYGDDFPRHLAGTYVAAIWLPNQGRLLVANDRWGPMQHFIQAGERFLLSPVMGPSPGTAKIDREGLRQLLLFGYVLGDRALLEAWRVLPPASILIREGERQTLRQYWHLNESWENPQQRDERNTVATIPTLAAAAVRDLAAGCGDVVMPLSGGLDSRFALGLLRAQDVNVTTITVEEASSCEAIYASELAKRLGTNHVVVPFDYDNAWPRLMWAATMHQGMVDVGHSFLPSHWLSELVESPPIMITGYMGDSVTGAYIMADDLFCPARKALDYLFRFNTQAHPADVARTVSDTVPQALKESVLGTMRQSVGSDGRPTYRTSELFQHLHLLPKFESQVVCGIALGAFEVRTPYTDYDYTEYFFGLPLGQRFLRRAYRMAIASSLEGVLDIPESFADLPVDASRLRILFRRLGYCSVAWASADACRKLFGEFGDGYSGSLTTRATRTSIMIGCCDQSGPMSRISSSAKVVWTLPT